MVVVDEVVVAQEAAAAEVAEEEDWLIVFDWIISTVNCWCVLKIAPLPLVAMHGDPFTVTDPAGECDPDDVVK